MLKFCQQYSDNSINEVGFLVVGSCLVQGPLTMMLEASGAVMVKAMDDTEGDARRSAVQYDAAVGECLLVANRLASVLREETMALQAFDSDLLLQLTTQKEALVSDLGGKLNAIRSDLERYRAESIEDGGVSTGGRCRQAPAGPDDLSKRSLLRGVLKDIERINEVNRIYIEGSLTYGRELLEVFGPGTYGVGQEGQAERVALNTKGFALDKEV